MEVHNQNLGIATKRSIWQTQPIASFILIKALPLIIYFLPKLAYKGFSISFAIFLYFSILEFKTVKDTLGIELIGIRWYIDPKSENIIQFYNKPAPYVPSFFESNVFWVGFFISLTIWGISFIFSLSSTNLINIFTTFIGLILQTANFFLFMRGQSKAQKEAAEQARNTLLTDSVEFGLIKEGDEENPAFGHVDSQEYEEEYEEEEEEEQNIANEV